MPSRLVTGRDVRPVALLCFLFLFLIEPPILRHCVANVVSQCAYKACSIIMFNRLILTILYYSYLYSCMFKDSLLFWFSLLTSAGSLGD